MGTFISTIHKVQLTMIRITLVIFVFIWALTKILVLVWDGNIFNHDLMMTTLNKILRDQWFLTQISGEGGTRGKGQKKVPKGRLDWSWIMAMEVVYARGLVWLILTHDFISPNQLVLVPKPNQTATVSCHPNEGKGLVWHLSLVVLIHRWSTYSAFSVRRRVGFLCGA